MIKRFNSVEGRYIEKIDGQDRLAFALSDTTDFYDLIEWSEHGGYKGSIISFYDFSNGNVYIPFKKKRNVVYGKPRYFDGFYYFLKCDYDEQKIVLYRYFPNNMPDIVTELEMKEVNLYNLNVVGEKIHIISQDNNFNCYYPKKFSFSLSEHETAVLIDDDKVYCEAWIEEGWDNENDCASDDYKYYDKIIVRDFEGNILSEEIGSLNYITDGIWWIS